MCATGAIPWLMVAELFLQEARPVAVTIATIVNWLANFVVGLAFPYILVSSHLSLSLSLTLFLSLFLTSLSSPIIYYNIMTLIPNLQQFLYPYGTAVFIVICSVVWVYLFIYLPETKGRSVDDITMEFRKRTGEIERDSINNKEPVNC